MAPRLFSPSDGEPPPARISASKVRALSVVWPIQPLAGRFTVAARIGEILTSAANQALSRRVTRKHRDHIYTQKLGTKVACRLLHLSPPPPLSPSASLVCSER